MKIIATQDQLQIQRWTRQHAIAVLVGVGLSLYWQVLSPFILTVLISFVAYTGLNQKIWKPLSWWGGGANWVTASRLVALLGTLGFADQINDFIIGAIALVIVITDGLDGYLARKYKTQSIFGEFFDKETDACFVMGMTLLIYQKGFTGSWILLLGLLRYFYVLTLIWVKPPEKKETRSFRGQLIAVLLMLSLITCFWLPETWYLPILMLISALVFYSFGKSFLEMILPSHSAPPIKQEQKENIKA